MFAAGIFVIRRWQPYTIAIDLLKFTTCHGPGNALPRNVLAKFLKKHKSYVLSLSKLQKLLFFLDIISNNN